MNCFHHFFNCAIDILNGKPNLFNGVLTRQLDLCGQGFEIFVQLYDLPQHIGILFFLKLCRTLAPKQESHIVCRCAIAHSGAGFQFLFFAVGQTHFKSVLFDFFLHSAPLLSCNRGYGALPMKSRFCVNFDRVRTKDTQNLCSLRRIDKNAFCLYGRIKAA